MSITIVEVKYGESGGPTGFSLVSVEGDLTDQAIYPVKSEFQIPREIALAESRSEWPSLLRFKIIEIERIKYFLFGAYQYFPIDELGRPTYKGKCICIMDIGNTLDIQLVYDLLQGTTSSNVNVYLSSRCDIIKFQDDVHFFIADNNVIEENFFHSIGLCGKVLFETWYTSDYSLINLAIKRSNVYSVDLNTYGENQVDFNNIDTQLSSSISHQMKELSLAKNKGDDSESDGTPETEIVIPQDIERKKDKRKKSSIFKQLIIFFWGFLYATARLLFNSKLYFGLSNILLLFLLFYNAFLNEGNLFYVRDETKISSSNFWSKDRSQTDIDENISLFYYINQGNENIIGLKIKALSSNKIFSIDDIEYRPPKYRPISVYTPGDVFIITSDKVYHNLDNDSFFVEVENHLGKFGYVEAKNFTIID